MFYQVFEKNELNRNKIFYVKNWNKNHKQQLMWRIILKIKIEHVFSHFWKVKRDMKMFSYIKKKWSIFFKFSKKRQSILAMSLIQCFKKLKNWENLFQIKSLFEKNDENSNNDKKKIVSKNFQKQTTKSLWKTIKTKSTMKHKIKMKIMW